MMLLRSSSTPLLSSKFENGGNLSRKAKNHHKTSFPVSPSSFKPNHIRRVSSDSNLNGTGKVHEVSSTRTYSNNYKSKAKLEPIPSFSLHDRNVDEENDEDVKNMDEYDTKNDFSFPRSGSRHDNTVEAGGGFELFEFLERINGTLWESSDHDLPEPISLYMAMGLGINPDLIMVKANNFSDDQMQWHYEKIVKENPCNPLILRNYARYLYQNKRDYKKAEEFYSRAVLADPNDGEVLSEYARLRWEINREEETASNYFESAVQASPENSNVLAAYASFLWDTEDKEETQDTEEGIQRQLRHTVPQ